MSLAPAEIRHVSFGRSLVGYRASAVDALLADVVESFEEVWRERADLRELVHELESDLQRYRDLEALLRTTLVSAERSAQELREHARRESELLVSEAHAEARAITRAAVAERERVLADSARVRAVLRSALETVEGASSAEPGANGSRAGAEAA